MADGSVVIDTKLDDSGIRALDLVKKALVLEYEY